MKAFCREGAGPGPTSSALMSDLSILRGSIKYPLVFLLIKEKKSLVDIAITQPLYLRLEVKDKPEYCLK